MIVTYNYLLPGIDWAGWSVFSYEVFEEEVVPIHSMNYILKGDNCTSDIKGPIEAATEAAHVNYSYRIIAINNVYIIITTSL